MKSSKAYDGAIVRAPFLVVPFSWWMHDVLAQGSDQFVEELSLTFGTVLVMDRDTFRLKLRGKFRRSAVVAAHIQPLELVVAGDGAHSYSAYSYKIYI